MSMSNTSYQGLGMYVVGDQVLTPYWEYKNHLTNAAHLNGVRCISNKANMLYITASAANELVSMDAATPLDLHILDTIATGSNPVGLSLDGDFVYVAVNGNSRIEKINNFSPENLTTDSISATTGLTAIIDVDVFGNYVYCCLEANAAALPLVRVNKNTLAAVNETLPVFAGHGQATISPEDGRGLYATIGKIGTANNLRMWDITDVGVGPVFAGNLPGTPGRAQSCLAKGNFLYTRAEGAVFYINNIHGDLIDPVYVGGCDVAATDLSGLGRMAISGNYVLCTGDISQSIVIFDVTDKANPVVFQIMKAGIDFPTGVLNQPFDITMWDEYGFITNRGNSTVVVIGPEGGGVGTLSLYDTLNDLGPRSLWNLDGMNLVTEQAVDDGFENNNLIMAGANAPSTKVGPNGGIYPECGNGVFGVGNFWGETQKEGYAGVYTSGMTMIVVAWYIGGGDMMDKHKTGVTNSGESMLVFGGNKQGANTTRAGFNLNATQCSQVASFTPNTWHIFEAYFPPGSSIPVIYRDGIKITDLNTSNFAARGDHGNGQVIVGGNARSGASDANGYYAIAGIYAKAFTDAQRARYRAAGQAEGWIP